MTVTKIGMGHPLECKQTFCQHLKEAEKKYGLRYTAFGSDGNSSVYTSFIADVHGWGYIPLEKSSAPFMP